MNICVVHAGGRLHGAAGDCVRLAELNALRLKATEGVRAYIAGTAPRKRACGWGVLVVSRSAQKAGRARWREFKSSRERNSFHAFRAVCLMGSARARASGTARERRLAPSLYTFVATIAALLVEASFSISSMHAPSETKCREGGEGTDNMDMVGNVPGG
eukprot:5127380-Pleurochrysis_carterae.AAC.1